MHHDFATLLFLLIVGHAVADYALQSDWMAKAKNPATAQPGVPWWSVMAAHCLIHGGTVWYATGMLLPACFEVVAHFFIDRAKCDKEMGFLADQTLHLTGRFVIAMTVWSVWQVA